MVEIKYINYPSLTDLEDTLNKVYLNKGWRLYGDLVVGKTHYIQAIIKSTKTYDYKVSLDYPVLNKEPV